VGLIDGFIQIGAAAGVRIGDCHASPGAPPDFIGRLTGGILRVMQRIASIGITVGPAVDRNGRDVPVGIEIGRSKQLLQEVQNVSLDVLITGAQQLCPANAELVRRRQTAGAKGAGQV